jgi:amino acid transporter
MSDVREDARPDSFGEETELKRDLGPVSATTVIVGSIIGSGIFAGPAIVAGYVGTSGWNLLVWVICAFMAFCGAVTFAELGGIMPRSGGLFVFLREAYGRLWGFLFGWTSLLVIRPADLAAISIVFATYLGYYVTQFSPYPDWAMRSVAVIVLVILAFINYLGVRFGGLVQNLSSFLKVGGLLLMVALAFGITPDTSQFEPVWPSDSTLTIGFLSMVSLGMVASFGAYDGWDASTYVAEEIKNPRRWVPLSIILGLAITTVVYLLVNSSYLLVLSNTGVAESERVASETMQVLIGPVGAAFIAATAMISTFGTVNAGILTGPRVFFAMARDKMFFSWVARVHPRYRTPSNAVVFMAALGILYIVFLGDWGSIIAARTGSLWLFYITTTFSVFIFRRTRPDVPRPYRTFGYPVTPAIFVLIGVIFFVSITVSNPGQTLIGLTITALGIPAYWIWTRMGKTQENAKS